MKKLILSLILVLLITSSIFSIEYPVKFKDLLRNYSSNETKVTLVTNITPVGLFIVNTRRGYIKLVADDYILFDDGELTIISINNIVEIHQ